MLPKGLNFKEQPQEFEFIPNTGWITVRVFHGSKDAIMAQAGAFAGAGYRVLVRSLGGGGLHELRVSVLSLEGTDPTVNTWELLGSDLQTDIKLFPAFQNLGDAVLEDVQAKIQNPDADVTIPTGDATTLYEMLLREQTAFQESRYVLRYTQTSSANHQASIAVAGVNQLWTASQIDNAHPGMPANIRAAVNNIPTPTIPADYAWRWLKHTPQLSKAAGQQTVITIEWTLYLWSTFLYGNA